MIAAATAGHVLSHAGLLLDALAAACALCLRGRGRRIASAAALVLTPLLLGGALWKSHQMLHLRHHPALAAAGIVAALVVVAALAWLFHRRPVLFALAAVVALPFRFSLLSGGTGGVLLVLYAVIGGGALALVIWGEAEDRAAAGALEWALSGYVVLYAIQALYTPDLTKAVQQLGFFYVPFALLFVLLRGVSWDRRVISRCAGASVALAILFAAIGIGEYAAGRLIFHVSLNSDQRYFRVNSLFYDPNIYGRYLALAMVLLTAWMLWQRGRREVAAAAGVLAFLWLGLLWSISQSSLVALLAGLAVLAVLRFPWRLALGGAAVAVAAIVVIAAADSHRLHLNFSNNSTSGRASLVRQGVDLFGDRPFAGFGSGSFSCEFLRHTSSPGVSCGAAAIPGITSDSHTAPVTVAAEQGVLGLLAYLALLIAAVLALARGPLRDNVVRAAILAAFVALVIHSWFYADFLEDPITWTLLAVGAACSAI
ncbi:MAG TPA: O-antigen ligase family protein [Solirubrobacteraceae bacterium]|jgi:O-antigen ligase|nr:O-antigen ligase family protein [Solirubrobacteraceae bacterium]